jgi:hypothetical protein
VGRERTEDDIRALFEAVGLNLARVIITGSHVSIVEGCRK